MAHNGGAAVLAVADWCVCITLIGLAQARAAGASLADCRRLNAV
ncbi:hypothetical protein ACU4GD_46060 [Cupriavidus basilensis]